MADVVHNHVYDGARNAVFNVTDFSDGTGLTNYNVTNVASLSPTNPGVHLKLKKIQYAIQGMSVRVQWAASTNIDIVILSPGENVIDYTRLYSGGISNDAGAGVTGDIVLTTIGASANSNMVLTLECLKGVRSVG